MNRLFYNKSLFIGLAMLSLVSCSNDDNSGTPEPEDTTVSDKYFLAGTSSDGTTTFTYTMAVKDLAKDTLISTNYPGTLENIGSYTQWGFSGTKALFAISYQQGQPAPGSVFQLSATGVLKKIDDFVFDKSFHTIGTYSHYLVAASNGQTLTGTNDGKKGSIFYSMNLDKQNAITQIPVLAEGFVGGDQIASFVGIADAGSENFFTAVNLGVGPSARPVNLDSIYVAKMDANMKLVTLYKDNRLSYSGGRRQSARYGQITTDSDGNTYVFSGANEATTTKKAGALLIKKNATAFDASYYFDIESASGGYKFKRIWGLSDDYVLLEIYNVTGVNSGTAAATRYAIIKMGTKDFKWVTGLPSIDKITSTGWPFPADGKAYVSIVTPDTNPTVYVIDPATAIAKKGISISGVTSIPGMGKLSPQSDIK